MTFIETTIMAFVAVLAFTTGWYLSRGRHWFLGQLFMKDKIRREINARIESGQIRIVYDADQSISCEQLLQLICYNEQPDPTDSSRGLNAYNPQ